MAGAKSEIDLGLLLRKRATIIGTMLRGRSIEEKAEATRLFASSVLPLVSRGAIRPVIDRVYPVDEIRDAHERMESNASFGKIVLTFAQYEKSVAATANTPSTSGQRSAVSRRILWKLCRNGRMAPVWMSFSISSAATTWPKISKHSPYEAG